MKQIILLIPGKNIPAGMAIFFAISLNTVH